MNYLEQGRTTPAIAEQAAIDTSETTRKTSPIDNIPQNEGNATKDSILIN